eukprot:2687273-Alexandrium_andersonii.AAC.1
MERPHERRADRPSGGPAARPIQRRPLDLRRRRQERPGGALVRAPVSGLRSDPTAQRLPLVAQELLAALR